MRSGKPTCDRHPSDRRGAARVDAGLELASLQPQHPGYMTVQDAACERVHAGLLAGESAAPVLADLDRMFEELGAADAGR